MRTLCNRIAWCLLVAAGLMTAASAHLSLTWHRSAPMYGQLRLGLPVDFNSL